MKTFKYLTVAALAATSLTLSSCDDKDDNKGGTDKPSIDDIIEDGFYISGEALPFTGVDVKGRMKAAINEADGQSARDGLFDIYITLQAGKTFSFTEVKGASTTTYGSAGEYKVNQDVSEEYAGDILKGDFAEGGSFTVGETNLYHVAIDKSTKKFVAVPVTQWCIIGDVSAAGWNDNDDINVLKGTYNDSKITYSKSGITLKEGGFKFRHSAAWKQTLLEAPGDIAEEAVKINTNFSGVAGALADNKFTFTNHAPGGDNATLTKDHRGVYTVSVTWELGKENFEVSIVRTGDADIADYPESMWLRGSGITGDDAGWGADYSIELSRVPGNAHLFWNVVYLHEGGGIKFDPTNEWNGDFGSNGDAPSEIEGGSEYGQGKSDIKIEGQTGYYVVSLNLKDEKIAVVNDVQIYLTGNDQTGTHGDISVDKLFTLEGDLFVSPDLKAGKVRMYAIAPYIDSWWQREFHITDNKIVHRIDDELDPAIATAGQKAYLNFRTGEAEIK